MHDSEMTLKGILMSGTGGSKSNDGEYSVIERNALDDGKDDFGCIDTGVNVARDGNVSTPRLASAGNFWKGR